MLRSNYLLALLATFVCIAGCAKPAQLGFTTPPSAEKEDDLGGINSGGGGTLPANPISVDQAIEITQNAKADLQLLVKYSMFALNEKTATPVERKLFLGSPNLWDILNTTDIEIRADRPCKNSKGEDRDGSIYASKPGAICISAYRIAPKLIIERAPVEIEALIMHELSHLLGTNEKEAVEFQKEMAFNLSQAIPHPPAKELLTKLQAQTEEASNALWQIRGDHSSVSDADLQKAMDTVSTRISKVQDLATQVDQSVLSKREAAYFFYQLTRFTFALHYQLSVTSGDYWKQEYEKYFAGQDSVTLGQILAIDHVPDLFDGACDGEVIHRIRSRADLRAEINAFGEYFEKFDTYVRQLAFNTRPNNLPQSSAVTANPWMDFVGDYQVVNKTCADGMDTVGFKIEPLPADSGRLHLTKFWKNGWGDDGGLYDGAMLILAGASTLIQAGSGWAERVSEMGDLWANHGGLTWSRTTLKIEKTTSGYKMTESHAYRQWNVYKPIDHGNSCVYNLRKKLPLASADILL